MQTLQTDKPNSNPNCAILDKLICFLSLFKMEILILMVKWKYKYLLHGVMMRTKLNNAYNICSTGDYHWGVIIQQLLLLITLTALSSKACFLSKLQ